MNIKAFLVGLTLLGMSVLPLQGWADEQFPKNTISVQGTGQIEAKPDSLQLQMGVQNNANTMEDARNENAKRMTAITQKIKALGIPKLTVQTSYFSVYPVRKQEKMSPDYYHASNSMTIKVEEVDTEKLSTYASQLIDASLAAGATNVNGVNFFLSQNNKAHTEAIQLAVKQARQTAEAIASAAGIKLLGVYSVETYSQPSPMRSALAAEVAAPRAGMKIATPVEVGDFDVSASVTMRYSIAN